MSDAQLAESTKVHLGLSHRHLSKPTNLQGLLMHQAQAIPDRPAFTFLSDDGSETTFTYCELDDRARRIAALLMEHASPGEPVALVYPAGIDFVAAFFGCIYAGMLAVPSTYPKPRRPMPRLASIIKDCSARVALTTAQTIETLDLPRLGPEIQQLDWQSTDDLPANSAGGWNAPDIREIDLAFLQYTSGSTSAPKGVMVSHANLMHNLEMIRRGFTTDASTGAPHDRTAVAWLPAYHDMGLIGGVLEGVYVGSHTVLMAPATFLQRPIRWLRAMSDYQGVVSGAPNFAYELCASKISPEQCADFDLSHWKVALSGAEPIRPETIERFARAFEPCGFSIEAFYPSYGLAEGTLLSAGKYGPARPTVRRFHRAQLEKHRVVPASHPAEGVQSLAGCGAAMLDQEIVIVDPQSRRACPPNQVGEIWLSGPSVAQGYWNRDEQTERDFRAKVIGRPKQDFLRTGDLGFLHDGELFVTGRLKDVIIIRGRNHYPQDIEQTAAEAHPALRTGGGAAVALNIDGEERLLVVHEINRTDRNAGMDEVIRAIRAAVAQQHEVKVYAVALIRQASLPLTTSGKTQRHLCREQFEAGDLKLAAQWVMPAAEPAAAANGSAPAGREPKHPNPLSTGDGKPATAAEVDRLAERIETWLLAWLVESAGVDPQTVDREKPFAEYGLDSVTAVEMSQELEDWLEVQLTPVLAWNYPTPRQLAPYLARVAAGWVEPENELDDDKPDNDFDQLLTEIEGLSDSEVAAELESDGESSA
jgi:acyl-CoA synthetase (AMP-forming)/AMP-acid ligase II/acyl carrier protein